MKKLAVFVAAGILTGCASRSDEIQASYVSPHAYSNHSCPQLREEAERISSKVAQLTGAQDSSRTRDGVATTVGVIIFWPMLFAVKGDGNTAAELARMKGEAEAIERASIHKKCGIALEKTANIE